MCDYCGCRDSGPTAELSQEHRRLGELSDQLRQGLAKVHDESDLGEIASTFHEFVHLLGAHAAKEELGLFPEAEKLGFLGDTLNQLIEEHERLHEMLADGPGGQHVHGALDLLAQHIEDEEWELFPHTIYDFDPEQWDQIAMAHLAVEEAFAEPKDEGSDPP